MDSKPRQHIGSSDIIYPHATRHISVGITDNSPCQ